MASLIHIGSCKSILHFIFKALEQMHKHKHWSCPIPFCGIAHQKKVVHVPVWLDGWSSNISARNLNMLAATKWAVCGVHISNISSTAWPKQVVAVGARRIQMTKECHHLNLRKKPCLFQEYVFYSDIFDSDMVCLSLHFWDDIKDN